MRYISLWQSFLAGYRHKDTMNHVVDHASDASFPASDPPAWTGVTAGGADPAKKS